MLLFVCHANICRSPMAERLARLALSGHPCATGTAPVRTESAGTHARAGDPMHPGTARVLRDLGADPSEFASRTVTADLLTRATLVLTATREQRAFCVRLAPVALRRTFTIRQFGRLAAATVASAGIATTGITTAGIATTGIATDVAGTVATRPMTALLERVASVRGTLQPVEPTADDLADPVNGTEDDLRACAHQIQLSLSPALALIGAA